MQSPRKSPDRLDNAMKARVLQGLAHRRTPQVDPHGSHGQRVGYKTPGHHGDMLGRDIDVSGWASPRRSPRAQRRNSPATNILSVDFPEIQSPRYTEHLRPIQENEAGIVEKPYEIRKCCIHVPTGHEKRECWITGCAVLSRDLVVVVDCGNSRVKVIDTKNSEILSRIVLPASPKDVTIVTKDTIAVTLPTVDTVQFLSMTGSSYVLDILRSIKVGGYSNGIDHFNEQLFVSFVNPPKIEILTLQGDIVKSFARDSTGMTMFKNPQYLTANEEAIFVTDADNNAVVKVSHDGDVMSRYEDEALKNPSGISLTGADHVVVCSQDTHCVHLLSTECVKLDILLTKEDAICYPHVIDNCRDSHTLYISSTSGQPNLDNFLTMYEFK